MLAKLISNVESSFVTDAARIKITVHTASVALSIGKAIPCGLIVNKLITNALKHAFPGSACGTIEVMLKSLPERRLQLSVSDDGLAAVIVSGFA